MEKCTRAGTARLVHSFRARTKSVPTAQERHPVLFLPPSQGIRTMNDQPLIDRIMAELSQRLPAGLGQLRGEVEANARAVLREAITRLDLITREEFDVQQQVLGRTRARLEQLEQIVEQLERQLADQ